MTPLMQQKLRQIEQMLEQELDAEITSRILTLLGWDLPEPRILEEVAMLEMCGQRQKHLHFLWHAFDKLPVSLFGEFAVKFRRILAKGMFATCGSGLIAEGSISIVSGCLIEAGADVKIGRNCSIDARGGVRLGNCVYLGDSVSVISHGLPGNSESRIIVDHHAQIGAHVTLFPGVRVGSGSVIAPGAIVTSDVPSDVIASGVPATILRRVREGLGAA